MTRLDGSLKITDTVAVDFAEIRFTTSRSGGPGGQHVNKTNSRVTLHFDVQDSASLPDAERARILARLSHRLSKDGVLLLHVDSSRSQRANKEAAIERLIQLLQDALDEPRERVPTKVTAGQKRRRLEDKKQRAARKQMRRPPAEE